MSDSRGTGPMGWLARLLVRGADAEFIRADLEEAYERELARGVVPWRARLRYLQNLLGSAASLWRSRVRIPRLSVSWLDVKLSGRMLRKHPGLTVVSVFAMSIGIPVGLVPLWLSDAVEAPLPHAEGERIQGVRFWNTATSQPESATWYDYALWREELTSFQELGATRTNGYNVAFDGAVYAPVVGAEVSASTFGITRTPPIQGRVLLESDQAPGAPPVVVIGESTWQGRFGGDAEILGRDLTVAGVAHTIVGVMPGGFRFPVSSQLWLPMTAEGASEPGQGVGLRVFGRLAEGVSAEEAHAELTSVGARKTQAFPDVYAQLTPEVVKPALMFVAFPRGGLRAMPAFYMVQALSLVLLLLACVNVALLIFARTATRASELSMRTALGATRARIVTQVFTECLVLAFLAAGVGLIVLGLLPSLIPAEILDALPYWFDFSLSGTVIGFALALAVISAVAAGVVPAWRFTGRTVQLNIQRARARRSGPFGGLSSALVVLDVAVCVAVIGFAVGIGDDLRSAWNAQAESVGFPDHEYLSVQISLPGSAPATESAAADRREFTQRFGEVQTALVERLEAEPGVRGVAVATTLPRMEHATRLVEVDGGTGADEPRQSTAKVTSVDVDFFDVLGTPVLAGREFDAGDLQESVSAAVVNESFVEQVLGGRNAIGRRVRYRAFGAPVSDRWYEIVGVVGRAGIDIMDPDDDAGLYLPLAPGTAHPVRMGIHVGEDPESFTPRLREITAEVDPNAVISSPMALDRVFEGDWYFGAAASLGALVGVGILLALAACGIYAIMSFTVARRTREIGLRAALGANPGQIAYAVARRSLAQLAVGVGLGLPIAWLGFAMATDAEDRMLVAFAASIVPGLVVMTFLALTACAAPTLRALRITPTEALREE